MRETLRVRLAKSIYPGQAHSSRMYQNRPLSTAQVVIITITFLATCLAGSGTCEKKPIHIDTEPGGDIFTGAAAEKTPQPQNHNGAIFWNSTGWMTTDTAAHLYFTDLRTGERLKPNITVLEVSGDNIGASRRVDNVSIAVKDVKYTDILASGKLSQNSVHDYEITVYDNGSGTWKLLLRSRSDGRDVNHTHFQVYVQDPLNHTLLFKEGVQAMATGLPITGILGWDIGGANRTFYMPNASSQYWLDVNGGSDMGGMTFKLVTGALDLAALGKGNGTTAVQSFEIMYTNSTGSLNRIVIHPQVETLSQEKGKSTPATPATTPAILLSVAILVALAVSRKRRPAF